MAKVLACNENRYVRLRNQSASCSMQPEASRRSMVFFGLVGGYENEFSSEFELDEKTDVYLKSFTDECMCDEADGPRPEPTNKPMT